MVLTFAELREANRRRLPQFRNARGELAHKVADGSDWTPADWVVALLGELGEAANIMKKMRRGDFGDKDDREYQIALEYVKREFADVIIYLDLLALQFDIDLGDAVVLKFNEKSHDVGATVFIGACK